MWSSQGMPGDLVSSDQSSAEAVGAAIDRRAYTFLLTRCKLLYASYKEITDAENDSLHRYVNWLYVMAVLSTKYSKDSNTWIRDYLDCQPQSNIFIRLSYVGNIVYFCNVYFGKTLTDKLKKYLVKVLFTC